MSFGAHLRKQQQFQCSDGAFPLGGELGRMLLQLLMPRIEGQEQPARKPAGAPPGFSPGNRSVFSN